MEIMVKFAEYINQTEVEIHSDHISELNEVPNPVKRYCGN